MAEPTGKHDARLYPVNRRGRILVKQTVRPNRTTRVILRATLLLTCLVVVGIWGCGDREAGRKAEALNVARNWAEANTDAAIGEVVTLVTSGVPGASLLRGAITDQISGFLSWDYSEPVKGASDIYGVTATVSTRASLDLPLLGSKTYAARLPFELQVDVGAGSVARWSADFDNAFVGEIETTP